MWAQVASRSYNPKKMFAFSEDSDNLMADGTVEFESKDGRKGQADWRAHCHFTKAEGQLKLDYLPSPRNDVTAIGNNNPCFGTLPLSQLANDYLRASLNAVHPAFSGRCQI